MLRNKQDKTKTRQKKTNKLLRFAREEKKKKLHLLYVVRNEPPKQTPPAE